MSDTPMTAPPTGADVTIEAWCPICGDAITLNLEWDGETDDMGYSISRYLIVLEDPAQAIKTKECRCDLTKPVMEAWADYLNDGRIDDYLDPHANDDADMDATAVPDAELRAAVEFALLLIQSAVHGRTIIGKDWHQKARSAEERFTAWLAQQEGRDER